MFRDDDEDNKGLNRMKSAIEAFKQTLEVANV
jgi:hypothetical protein